jgi:hypothetical protein
MKVLVVIPHFHDAAGNGSYGSTGPNSAKRAAALSAAIGALHQQLGPRQALLHSLQEPLPGRGNGRLLKVNSHAAAQLDIVVCTVADKHLLERLSVPRGMFHHQPVQAHPMMLGFAARQVFAAQLGRYDFYCYMEDDLVLLDAMFLAKIAWFTRTFGDKTLLLPHRYEVSEEQPVHKLYLDGPVRPDFTAQWQDVEDRSSLEGEYLGGRVAFGRCPNPNAGSYFLNDRQMAKWVAAPDFRDTDCSFAGPIESACCLGIMRNFRLYKPALANAGFLEIRHDHNRYLGAALRTN